MIIIVALLLLNKWEFFPGITRSMDTCKLPAPNKKIALSFDDQVHIPRWNESMSYFEEYNVHATFYIDRQNSLSEEDYATLHHFVEVGHEIGLHTLEHKSLADHLNNGGVENEWFEQQVIPSMQIMEQQGFEIESFSYPFGERTIESDKLIHSIIPVLRGVEGNPKGAENYYTFCSDKSVYGAINIADGRDNLEVALSIIQNQEIGTLLVYAHNINGTGDSISHHNLVQLFETANHHGWEFILMKDLAIASD